MKGNRDLLVAWGVTRAGLLLVALLGSQLLVSGLVLQTRNLVYPGSGPLPIQVWSRWDGEWYRLIAERGYRGADRYIAERQEGTPGASVSYAPGDATGFFPLYPLLLRLLAGLGIPTLAGGVLVANLALLVALRLLRDLARLDEGAEAAERAVWALLCFPTSFFLSAVYAESLLLACLLASLRAARAGRPLLAGGFAALCALSKPTGFLVLLPLFDELLVARRERTITWLWRTAAALAMPCAAVGAYMLYCRHLYGDPLAFLARQERWRHGGLSWPWRAFLLYLESPRLHDQHHSTIDLVVALLCLAAIPWMFLRLRRSYALYGAAAILLPLGSTLWSFSRFAAAIFPLYLLIGSLTARSTARFAGYLAITAPLAGFFMALYAAWWWVG